MTALQTALSAVEAADSPEAHAEAVAALLDAMAQVCVESGAECAANWQDPGAAAPWRQQARILSAAALRLTTNYV